MQETNKVGIIVLTAIFTIIGLILFSAIDVDTHKVTTLFSVTNETALFDGSSNTSTLAHGNITSVTYFGNGTTDLTAQLGTLVNYTASGTVYVDNTTVVSTINYNISYSYMQPNYLNDSTSRTFINLIDIFYALGIIAVVILGLYKLGLSDMLKK